MSVVVGIDPSLTVSGCARVDLGVGADGQLDAVRWETWRARAMKGDVVSVETNRRRIRGMLREILALVPDFVDLFVVEGPSMGSKFTPLADERSGLRWMLIDQLMPRGPVVLVSPTTRALLGAGKGNAKKPEVLAAVRALWPDVHVPDDNVADAVALATAGARALGAPVPYTDRQELAHAKVAWPVVAGSPAGER